MEGRKDGKMNERRKEGWRDVRKRRKGGEWMEGKTDGRMNKRRKEGRMEG